MAIFYWFKRQRDNLYLGCLAFFLFLMTIQLSYFVPFLLPMNQIFLIVKLISTIVGLKFLLFDRWSVQQKIVIFIMLIFFYYLTTVSHDSSIFYYAVFIVGAADVPFRKILTTYLCSATFSTLVIILAYLIRLIPGQIITRLGHHFIMRFSLGFLTPTDFAARTFYLLLAYYAWRNLQLKKIEQLVSLLLIFLIFILTNARLDLILMLSLWLVGFKSELFIQLVEKINYKFLTLFVSCYILGNVSLAYFFNPHSHILQQINHLLSNRLLFGYIALHQHGISLLGKYIIETSNGTISPHPPANYFYVDSSYIRLLVISGMLVSILVMFLLYFLLKKIFVAKEYGILVFLLLAILSSAIDQHLVELSYNIIFLATFASVNQSGTKENSFLGI